MNAEHWLVDLHEGGEETERRLTVLVEVTPDPAASTEEERADLAAALARIPLSHYDEDWTSHNPRQIYPPVEVGRKGEGKGFVGKGSP